MHLKLHASTSTVNKSLIIIAHSARALAQSAKRAGYYDVITIDGFADTDTQQACSQCWCIPLQAGQFNRSKVITCIRQLYLKHPRAQVLPGPGGEFYVSYIKNHLTGWQVLGCSAETIHQTVEPSLFFARLDQLHIPYPPVSLSADVPREGDWLRKSVSSCGGLGVIKNEPTEGLGDACYYWQQELPGRPVSALAISDGEDCRIIGFNQQMVRAISKQVPYAYAGAIANIELTEVNTIKTESYIKNIAKYFNMRGVFSLDMLLVDETLFILEVNPRISSTFELYQYIQPLLNLVDAHIRVCEGDALYDFEAVKGVAGEQIMYADQDYKIKQVAWPDWISDRPHTGQHVLQGEPLCSVFAQGDEVVIVQKQLQARVQQVPYLLQ